MGRERERERHNPKVIFSVRAQREATSTSPIFLFFREIGTGDVTSPADRSFTFQIAFRSLPTILFVTRHTPIVSFKNALPSRWQVRKNITSNTIMIFASAPSWPHGVIDPIEELPELRLKESMRMVKMV